jgi:hypothetical protein
VLAAAVDAVRREDGDEPPTTTEVRELEKLAHQLARLGPHGELVLYGEACGVRVLALPTLELMGDDQSGCGPRGAVSPDGATIARCNGTDVELFGAGGLARTLPGCAPAWRPDGTLTVAHQGAVVRFRACPDGRDTCTERLIQHAELLRAAREHPTSPALAPLRVLVDGVAWLSDARAAVLVSIRLTGGFAGMGPMRAIAFFEDGRLAATQPFFGATGGRLGASPRGTYVTQTPDVILRADGTRVSLPPHLHDVRSFTWSPDERFLAIATEHAVVVIDTGSLEGYDARGGGLRSVTIPQPAVDIQWR